MENDPGSQQNTSDLLCDANRDLEEQPARRGTVGTVANALVPEAVQRRFTDAYSLTEQHLADIRNSEESNHGALTCKVGTAFV
jgi:hypothetical protein